jgi:hypothetical protein
VQGKRSCKALALIAECLCACVSGGHRGILAWLLVGFVTVGELGGGAVPAWWLSSETCHPISF